MTFVEMKQTPGSHGLRMV